MVGNLTIHSEDLRVSSGCGRQGERRDGLVKHSDKVDHILSRCDSGKSPTQLMHCQFETKNQIIRIACTTHHLLKVQYQVLWRTIQSHWNQSFNVDAVELYEPAGTDVHI
jgi:hypothetical protein